MAGIVEDNGGFSGIIPAAHEIGHLYVTMLKKKSLTLINY